MAHSNWGEWRKPERADPSSLYLVFGCQPYGAHTTCDDIHPRPFREDEAGCCARCHRSGIDDDPSFRETAADKLNVLNWTPEGGEDQWSDAEKAEPTSYRGDDHSPGPRTRRQRRAQKYGDRSVAAVSMDPARLGRAIERGCATSMA